jgi:hypothetical protein
MKINWGRILNLVIPLFLLYFFAVGCQQGEEVSEQPSADSGMDVQTARDRVAELETATNSADTIIGSWKLNIEKSNFAEGQSAPKEQTEVYRESGPDQIELTYESIDADGTSYLYIINIPAQGGLNKWLQGDNEGTMEVETLLSPSEWCMTRLKDGKQVGTIHKVISPDGKTMRQTSTGRDEQGRADENILLYERQ